MKVSCPECGKSFSIPDSDIHRGIQCSCKNIFKAADHQATSGKPEGLNDESTVQLETRQGFYGLDDDSVEPAGNLSGDELDNLLGDLKKQRASMSQNEVQSKAPVKLAVPQGPIEIDDSKIPQRAVIVEDEPLPDEILNEPTSSPSSARPPLSNPQDSLRMTRPETKFWDRMSLVLLRWEWPQWTGFSVGVLILGFGVWFVLHEPPVEIEEKMDPSIAKLLAPVQSPEPTPSVAPIPAPPPAVTPKPAPAATTKKQEAARPNLAQTMREQIYRGDFKKVTEINKRNFARWSLEEKSLFWEAQLFAQPRNTNVKTQVVNEIKAHLKKNPDNTSLLRAQSATTLFGYFDRPALNRAREVLRSLALTQSRDPLVFVYLGLLFERYERMDLAHQAWDQALTQESRLVWLLKRRDQAYRKAKDFSNAQVMAERLSQISGFEREGQGRIVEINRLKNEH
jgi:hypothetical protein